MDARLRNRNLRDLGGLRTSTGFVVAPGRFFRSSNPWRFDAEERRALAALNLRSIVDLRTTAELSPSSHDAVSLGVQVFHLPLFESARPNWIAPADRSPHAAASRYFEMLGDGFPTLATVVTRVAQPERSPFLIACAAGRDRTGIVVACLLDLLDVMEVSIGADYARSGWFDEQSGWSHPETVFELLRLLRHHHGSTRRMLTSFGVAEDVIEGFRRSLLVSETKAPSEGRDHFYPPPLSQLLAYPVEYAAWFKRDLDALDPDLASQLWRLESFPLATQRAAVEMFLSYACTPTNMYSIELGRAGLLETPPRVVRDHLAHAVRTTINLSDEWELRRLLEILCFVDVDMARGFASAAAVASDPEIAEAGEDTLWFLATLD